MRTTLKRGVGRSAAADGNGRVALPPGALTAIALYEQPRPRRRGLRIVGRVFFILIALGTMAAAGLVSGSWLYAESKVDTIEARDRVAKRVSHKLDLPEPDKPAIALLLGYDRRHGEGKGVRARSDTLMLVRVNPEEGSESITLLSFPRDLAVQVHCPGRAPFEDRINAAYSTCGEVGAVQTVKAYTNLPINYLVSVNFRGFTQVVDKLGGVWMDVDRRYYNDNTGPYGYAAIDLQPGYQKLFGNDALAFVRYRHTDTDLHRNARQQLFMRALKERLSTSLNPERGLEVVEALSDNVRVTVGGGKRLSTKTVLGYALLAYKLPSGNVFRVRLENLAGTGAYPDLLRASPESVEDAVDEFVNPDIDAPEKAAAAALGQRARLKRGLPPRQVSVVVLNGNNVEGAATNASAQLAERGYQTLLPPNGQAANAPRSDYFRTVVYYGRKNPRAKEAARQVANLFGSADIEPIPAGRIGRLSNGAMLVAVVGQTFKGTLAPAPKDRTPERNPPAVVRNPDATRAALREARRTAGFALYLPTKIEKTSVLDHERGVRVYKISGDRRAVRLTFRTGQNEYWGIQQTNWDDAPVFEGRNTVRTIKGRDYELYFSGTKLHMVVVRDGERSYWVINTLLDSLSNDTMIAIARGLKPLKRR